MQDSPLHVIIFSSEVVAYNRGQQSAERTRFITRTEGASSNLIKVVFRYDFMTISSAWELTSVYMRYSLGDGVNTSLSRMMYCTHA